MASPHMDESLCLRALATIVGSQSSSKCCDTWNKKVLSRLTCVLFHNSHIFTKFIAIYDQSTGTPLLESSNSMFGSTPSCATRTSTWVCYLWGSKTFCVFTRLTAISKWINQCFQCSLLENKTLMCGMYLRLSTLFVGFENLSCLHKVPCNPCWVNQCFLLESSYTMLQNTSSLTACTSCLRTLFWRLKIFHVFAKLIAV